MSNPTRLVRDDAYEEMGTAYQCVLADVLDSALREHGVADAALRQKVCRSFVFNMGCFHDQGWLKATPDGGPLYPLLCFTERFLNTDTPVEGLGAVYAPPPLFAFHEYAGGSVDAFFEGDPAARVETGNFEGGDDDDGD